MRGMWGVEKAHIKQLSRKAVEFCLGKMYTLQNLFMLVTEILMPGLTLNKRIYSFCWFVFVYSRAGETFMEISNTSVNFSVT